MPESGTIASVKPPKTISPVASIGETTAFDAGAAWLHSIARRWKFPVRILLFSRLGQPGRKSPFTWSRPPGARDSSCGGFQAANWNGSTCTPAVSRLVLPSIPKPAIDTRLRQTGAQGSMLLPAPNRRQAIVESSKRQHDHIVVWLVRTAICCYFVVIEERTWFCDVSQKRMLVSTSSTTVSPILVLRTQVSVVFRCHLRQARRAQTDAYAGISWDPL